MSDQETETQNTEPAPDVETEIAEQMSPDDEGKPGRAAPNPDEEEVIPTGPGPESPFAPPELHPDEEEAETEDAPLEDYAPGVAEARLMSEREAEELGRKLDAERKRHGKKVMELLGGDLGGHIPCPTCMDGIDGFIISPEIAPLDTEQRERMMQILGLDDWEHMPSASWAEKCPTCDGFGKIKTGSKVPGREVTGCEDCGEAGWVNMRSRAAGNGHAELPEEGVTGPTVLPMSEPDPRANALRGEGWTVIPPMPIAVGD